MKAVLLAGGFGTRLSEETSLKPKPMVEIGGSPILWHIMKIYHHHGVKEFVVCLGYKGYVIKEYFQNYRLHQSDITFDFATDRTIIHSKRFEDWKVTLIDTGDNAMTGGRIKRILPFVEKDDNFCLTYGDGVADINIRNLIDFHKAHDKLATMTAVAPPGRFGAIEFADENDDTAKIKRFIEKPSGDGGLINGGFFVLKPEVGRYITKGAATVWEQDPLRNLASDGELMAFRHDGFWQPMDTLRDKNSLDAQFENGTAPWKVW